MVLKNLQLICKKYKQSRSKLSNTFFVSRKEGQLKERIAIGVFAVFNIYCYL